MEKKRPSVGELIDYTKTGKTLDVRHLPDSFTISEILAFDEVLTRYHSLDLQIHKVAIFHALSDYKEVNERVVVPILEAYMSIGMSLGKSSLVHLLPKPFESVAAQETVKQTEEGIYASAEEICGDIKRIENAISSKEKVVLRGDRSENLGDSSAVLSSIYPTSHPYGAIYENENKEKVRMLNTTMRVSGDKKVVPIHPLLKGVSSRKDVENGSNARWAINQGAVKERFEQWCDEADRPRILSEKLTEMSKKRIIMRIFNSYIDVVTETESTFLQENEVLQETIERNREMIIDELIIQLRKHADKYVDESSPDGWKLGGQAVINKYLAAFKELHYGLTDEMLCDLLADETPDEEVATSQLYEAA